MSPSSKSHQDVANVLRDSQLSPTFHLDRLRVMIVSSRRVEIGLLTVIAIRGRAVKGLSLADHFTPDAARCVGCAHSASEHSAQSNAAPMFSFT
jgi:hypothetical protein